MRILQCSAMKNKLNYFLLFTSIMWLSGCVSVRPKAYYDKNVSNWEALAPPDTVAISHTVYLIGDAGQSGKDKEPAFRLLEKMLYKSIDTSYGPNPKDPTIRDTIITYTSEADGTVIFLGDNIYYKGMPKEDDADRKEMEHRIIEQMKIVKNYKGGKYFIPGNHDWGGNEGGPDGPDVLKRQEDFVEAYLDSANVFLPSNACPGPVEVPVNDNLVIVFIDSQWWLHKWRKPVGPENGCNVDSKFDLVVQLTDILEKNREKNVVICQHHPLMTNGNHGGFYTFKDYFFPLTLIRDNLFIPLPVIGSIYPFARKYGISRQDVSHPEYDQMIKAFLGAMQDQKYVVFAAGHEHSLQFHKYGDINHIVSGTGCKDSYVAKGNGALFSVEKEGFVKINYYSNGEVWSEFWIAEKNGEEGKLVFRNPLYAQLPRTIRALPEEERNFRDSAITMQAGNEYRAGRFSNFLLGKHYREEWITPVTVKYLDMKSEAGGLNPIKKGGGRQTTSIRFSAKNGFEYSLRTVNKDPASVLPSNLRETFAEDLLQDQISSSHPYASLTTPLMAEKAGIIHTTRKLVYVPITPLLGHYIDDVGGKLGILEVRPHENMRKLTKYGNCDNVVSTRTMYFNLKSDNENSIDEALYLRSRLFDMLINDWDRHEDQWLWAEYEYGDKKIYRPVPRDRDQAYTKYDGVIPFILSRKWAVRNLHNFSYDYGDIEGLNLSGGNLDRNLLTRLGKNDWLRIADSMKVALDDATIENAIRQMPEEAFKISGEEIIAKLKSRRDKLTEAAFTYYRILAKNIEILASDEDEIAYIQRLNDRQVRVRLYDRKGEKKGELFYDRTFDKEDTKEIRLFMLGGEDSVLIVGDVKKSIKIRVIGGEGKDLFQEESKVKGMERMSSFYDSKEEKNVHRGKEGSKHLSAKYDIEQYEIDAFQYNHLGPKIYMEFNVDDGLFIGGGIVRKTHGFRKEPFKSYHSLAGNIATKTMSYNLKYSGNFYSLLGKDLDLIIDGLMTGPKYTLNYFGEGNETVMDTSSIYFYRIRTSRAFLYPSVHKRFSRYFKVGLGPLLESAKVVKEKDKIVLNENLTPPEELRTKVFGGAKLFTEIDLRDVPKFTRRGSYWRNEATYLTDLNSDSTKFLNLNTDFTFFITPPARIDFTIALRIGGGHNIGAYNFYQSNFLGGNTNLRGFRNTRFAGRSSIYQNTELRLKISNFKNYVLTGTWGLLGFSDQGRVWVPGEDSKAWHWAYGPGAWINFYNQILISTHYGFSKEGGYFTIKGGMFF